MKKYDYERFEIFENGKYNGIICPICKNKMIECDRGPDGYDDDINYSSNICFDCDIQWHGWYNKWYADADDGVDYKDGFDTFEELKKFKESISVFLK